jgi:hypothetical protein
MAKVIAGVFPEKEGKKKENKPVPGYILGISLMFSDPLIWRRVAVPGSITLATLHKVIQLAMGWSDSHVHQFLVGKISYEPALGTGNIGESKRFDERKFKLYTLEEDMGFMFTYLYDAGEGWEHDIRLEEILPPDQNFTTPALLSGEQACPPENVGDIHEYQSIIEAAEKQPGSGYSELAELSGIVNFDPGFFDLETAKQRLADL